MIVLSLWLLSVAQAGVDQICEDFARKNRIRTRLTEIDIRPKLLYQRIHRTQLRRLAGISTVLGLTESSMESTIEFKTKIYGMGNTTCVFLTNVIVYFGYQNQKVYIDNRYRPGSCDELDALVEAMEEDCDHFLSNGDEQNGEQHADESEGEDGYAEKLHDPSKLAFTGDSLVMVATEPFVDDNSANSAFLLYEYKSEETGWVRNETIFPNAYADLPSDWIEERFAGTEFAYWAPAMPSANEIYYSVYALSNPGQACIGYATALGTGEQANWTDSGAPVVCTTGPESNDQPVAIDPAVFDDENGERWMVWGSHGSGIYVVQLDESTGRLSSGVSHVFSEDSTAFHRVAHNEEGEGDNSGIEAPFVFFQDGYYFLFVNWGACCAGTESTYNIRVGRSLTPQGPYLDKDGEDMRNGGGSLFLASEGRFHGPGHAGVFEYGDQLAFSYHFYDEHPDAPNPEYNWASMGIRALTIEDGWPVLGEELAANEILRALE